MPLVRKIAKNAFFLYSGEIIAKVLTFVAIIAMARYFGPEEFGRYSFAITFASFLYYVIDFGTNRIFVRDVACDEKRFQGYFNKCLSLKLCMSAIFLPVFVAIAYVSGKNFEVVVLVCLFGLAIVFNSLIEFFKAVYRTFGKMELEGVLKVTDKLLWLGIVGVIVFFGLDLYAFATLFVIMSVVNLFLGISLLKRCLTRNDFRFSMSFSRALLKKAAPFALSAVFYIIYFRIGVVILSFLKGDIATGIYNVAYQLIDALIAIPSIFESVLYPVLSSTYLTDRSTCENILKKAIKALMLLVLPIAVGITILSRGIVILLFGEPYAASAGILQILIWMMIFFCVSTVLGAFMMVIKREKLLAKCLLFLVIFNVMLNFFLILPYGTVGTAWAVLLTEIAFSTTLIVMIYRNTRIFVFDRYILKIILASLLMGLVTYLISNLNLFFVISVSALIYVFFLFILKAVSKEEVLLAKSVFHKSAVEKPSKKLY